MLGAFGQDMSERWQLGFNITMPHGGQGALDRLGDGSKVQETETTVVVALRGQQEISRISFSFQMKLCYNLTARKL